MTTRVRDRSSALARRVVGSLLPNIAAPGLGAMAYLCIPACRCPLCRQNFHSQRHKFTRMDRTALGLNLASFIAAAAVSFGLLLWLKPLLARYALAKPNARSSHKEPTPQGGGLAVIAAAIIVAAPVEFFFLPDMEGPLQLQFTVLLASPVGLALVGVIDDVRSLGALPRLVLQTAAVAAVIAALPHEMRIIPAVPWWLDRALALVGGDRLL